MMLPPSQIGNEYKSVIVNKPALQAWLHAWTTGVSFLTPINPVSDPRKAEKLALATLRRLQSDRAK